MRTDENNASVAIVAVHQVLPPKQGPVLYAAQHLRQGRGTAEEEFLPGGDRLAECRGKDRHVLIVRAVHRDLSKSRDRFQFCGDPVYVSGTEFFQRDPAAGGGGETAAGFFLAPFAQGGGRIAEAFILRKLRLSGRDQLLALPDIVDAAQGIATAFREEGVDHLAVKVLRALPLQCLPEHFCLHGPVAAQRRVAPTQQDEVCPGLRRDRCQVLRDLQMLRPALRRGEPAGIGEDEKHLLRRPEGIPDGLPVPAGVDIDIVHGLDAGGVVVQDNDLSLQAGKGFFQPQLHLFRVRRKLL